MRTVLASLWLLDVDRPDTHRSIPTHSPACLPVFFSLPDRYGKNLRLYYRYWERLGFPTNMFFDWLDSKGEAAGQPLPELDECPRSQLDSDTVLYITDEQETNGYAVQFVVDESGRAIVVDVDSELVRTGIEGWIFVLRDNAMYAAQKITSVKGHCKQRFHHSSFFGELLCLPSWRWPP